MRLVYSRIFIGLGNKIVYYFFKILQIIVGAALLYLHTKTNCCTHTR